MSLCLDLPKGKGVKHLNNNDHHIANGNGSRVDLEENSNVFVIGVITDNPVVEKKYLNAKESNSNAVQVGELNHCENGGIVPKAGDKKENGLLGEGTGVGELKNAVSDAASTGKGNGDSVEIEGSCKSGEGNGADAVQSGTHADQIATESAPKPEENLESQIKDLDSAGELGESEFMPSGAGDSGDVKLKSNGQRESLLITEVGEDKEAQNVVLKTAERELPRVEEGKSHPETERQLAKEVHESMESETNITSTDEAKSSQVDSGEMELEDEKKSDSGVVIIEKKESERTVTDNVQSELNQESEAEKSASKVDHPMENEMAFNSITYGSDVSQINEEKENGDGSQEAPDLNVSSSRDESTSSANSVELESENGHVPVQSGEGVSDNAQQEIEVENTDVKDGLSGVSPSANDGKPEMTKTNGPVAASSTSDSPSDNASLLTDIVSGSVEPTRVVLPIEHNDIHAENSLDMNLESEAEKSSMPISEDIANNNAVFAKCNTNKTPAKSSKDEFGNDVAVSAECEIAKMSAPSIGHVPINDVTVYAECASENNSAMSGGDVPSNDVVVSAECESESRPAHSGGDVPKKDVAAYPTSEIDTSFSISSREISSNDMALSGSKVLEASAFDGSDVPNTNTVNEDVENAGDPINMGVANPDERCAETEDTETTHSDSISTSLPEISSTDAVDRQNVDIEVVKRPFNFLVKTPRFDDDFREKIRHAQLQVGEKTCLRDVLYGEMRKTRANCHSHHDDFEVAKSEERAARSLVKLKRQEIDSVQSVINRVKNAISVEDIDARIFSMQHMIEHETLPLNEEKQFIREIKQLKHLREQLSSNMGSQDEVQQALKERDQIEERLKKLKKELDGLKDKVLKAETASIAAWKKYNDERNKLKEFQAHFRAADDVRQEAYMQLQNLRKELFEKNKLFRAYKDDSNAAYEYKLSGDTDALNRLCLNQVETILELWNNNAEFRTEYVRCNMKSTLRRIRTLDGRSLGPDEEPPVVPSYVEDKVNKLISGSGQVEFVTQMLDREEQVASNEIEIADGMSTEMVAEQIYLTGKAKAPTRPRSATGLATVSGRYETESTKEEEHLLTEEQDLARKADELRKEEAAEKLREQRRLEEKVKAEEALERKKRNAEKAQIKAELRAQKEAEQKEKEREKRMRKKQRKKAAATESHDGTTDGENSPPSEAPIETNKEPGIMETPVTMTRKTQKPSQFTKQLKTKSIPPPLRNRGKKRLQQCILIIFSALILVALFLLGSISFFSNLGCRKMFH